MERFWLLAQTTQNNVRGLYVDVVGIPSLVGVKVLLPTLEVAC